MSKNSITIQINSLAALERLIGGDSEVELSLRNAIVQNFTKRYLKDLVSNEEIRKAINTIKLDLQSSVKEEFQKVFGQYVKTHTGPFSKIKSIFVLNSDVKYAIKSMSEKVIEETIDSEIITLVQKAKERLNLKVIRYLREETDKAVSQAFKEGVNSVLNKLKKGVIE